MMIDSTEKLTTLIERAKKTDAVALDTEFVWERTYYPRLGLIQLALSREECFLIDPLTITDLSSLGELLADQNVIKILHDAPQDLAILRAATGGEPNQIFDTRLAAGFAGLSSTLSLTNLLEMLMGITLPKTETRTNWLKRPLHSRQTEYAIDDVRYLRAMRRLLLERCTPEAKEWLQEELQRLNTSGNYTGIDDQQRYTKVKGAGNLNRSTLAILQELAVWRENEARRKDRPRGHIVRDNVLYCIAKQQLVNAKAIQECGDISTRCVKAYGKAMIEAVNKGMQRSAEDCPPLLHTIRLNKNEQTNLNKLKDYIAQHGERHGIDPALLGNMAELKELTKRPLPEMRQQQGWRKEFLAHF